jgi:hypothetical protein
MAREVAEDYFVNLGFVLPGRFFAWVDVFCGAQNSVVHGY